MVPYLEKQSQRRNTAHSSGVPMYSNVKFCVTQHLENSTNVSSPFSAQYPARPHRIADARREASLGGKGEMKEETGRGHKPRQAEGTRQLMHTWKSLREGG